MAVSPFVILDLPFSVHVTSICIPSFCLYVMSKLFSGIRLGRNGFAVLSSESFLIEVDKILIEAIFSKYIYTNIMFDVCDDSFDNM
jgi:hypothetical protein